MPWDSWIISISIGVVALAFVALVIFLGVTLLSVRRTVVDLEDKIHTFDPLFRVVNKTNEAIERKSRHVRQLSDEVEESCHEKQESESGRRLNTVLEVAEWALVGLAIWMKIKERK